MGKQYKSSTQRLNEARLRYNQILNEAPGFPGMCCDGGPVCVNVSFSSTSEDCSIFGMDECGHSDCMGDPGPIDPIGPIDNDVLVHTSGEIMIDCQCCQDGYPVSIPQQVSANPGCSALNGGSYSNCQDITNHTPLSCDSTTGPCDWPTISSPCAIDADLVNQFVSGNPSQFLSNIETWYNNPPGSGTGCDFLEVVRQKHIGHLQTGIAINGNHPNGIQMGPLWIAQKTSKVAYLDCVLAELNTQGCCDGRTPNNPVDNEIKKIKKQNKETRVKKR
tara:strand:- start:244 stop:1071 length:828 start_codon:yes stop_codon:yes gene_type:complete